MSQLETGSNKSVGTRSKKELNQEERALIVLNDKRLDDWEKYDKLSFLKDNLKPFLLKTILGPDANNAGPAFNVFKNLKISEGDLVSLLPALSGPHDQLHVVSDFTRQKACADHKELFEAINKRLKETKSETETAYLINILPVLGSQISPALPYLVKSLKTDDDHVLGNVLSCLRIIGDAAKSTIPAIANLIQDNGLSDRLKLASINILCAFGEIPFSARENISNFLSEHLWSNLKERGTSYLNASLSLARCLGKEGDLILGSILECYRESETFTPFLKKDIGAALKEHFDSPLTALKTYCRILEKDDLSSKTRCGTIMAIANLEESAAPAVPTLLKYMNDTDNEIRTCAAFALRCAGPTSETVPVELEDALIDQDVDVRWNAVQAVTAYEKISELAISRVADLLSDDSREVRKCAQEAVIELGSKAIIATPKLREDLRGEKPTEGLRSLKALLSVYSDNANLIPLLTNSLDSANPKVKIKMILELCKFDNLPNETLSAIIRNVPTLEDKKAVTAVIHKLYDGKELAQDLKAESIKMILHVFENDLCERWPNKYLDRFDKKDVIAAVLSEFSQDNSRSLDSFLNLISAVPHGENLLVPGLINLIDSDNVATAKNATETLNYLLVHRVNNTYAPELAALLGKERPLTIELAFSVLQHIGKIESTLIPQVSPFLEHENQNIRRAAVKVIKKTGTGDKTIRRKLAEIAKSDPIRSIRVAAKH
jgi:HEAT repeat protein